MLHAWATACGAWRAGLVALHASALGPLVDAYQAAAKRVLVCLPERRRACGRANAAELALLREEHPTLEVFTVGEWAAASDLMFRDAHALIRRAVACGARFVVLTEAMSDPRHKKSAEFIFAHYFRRWLTPRERDAAVILDAGTSDLFQEVTLMRAAGGSGGAAAPLLTLVLNDGAFSGNQQCRELKHLLGRAAGAGVFLDVHVFVPFATRTALARLDACVREAACGTVHPPVRLMRERMHDLAVSSFAMFEHKGPPVSPAFPEALAPIVERRMHPSYRPGMPIAEQPPYVPVYKAATEGWRALRQDVAVLAAARR